MASGDRRLIERLQLEHFVRVFAGFPLEACSHSDRPDMIVRAGGRTIGIEHTEVFVIEGSK